MSFLFGSPSPAEQLKRHQRALNKSIRELDRERQKLEQQDKTVINDIKKAARDGQEKACKIMAKDLVRTRKQVQKFYQMRTQLQAVALRIQTLRSNQAMSDAMKGVTRAMRRMNSRMNLPAIQKIMMDFERESEVMDLKSEIVDDAVDDAIDDEEDEEESDAIVNQILDEIGISIHQSLPGTSGAIPESQIAENAAIAEPMGAEGGSGTVGTASGRNQGDSNSFGLNSEDLDLQSRLDNLKRDD